MTNIYEQHDKAFNRVSAFVIARDGERVANVAIKFPLDGASRLYAYVQWIGMPMVRGSANGYGYDKRSAAVADSIAAVSKIPGDARGAVVFAESALSAFVQTAQEMDSQDWTRALEKAGFQVWQAV